MQNSSLLYMVLSYIALCIQQWRKNNLGPELGGVSVNVLIT
jgi:hypothetical protein